MNEDADDNAADLAYHHHTRVSVLATPEQMLFIHGWFLSNVSKN
jgi:hypothetical protein